MKDRSPDSFEKMKGKPIPRETIKKLDKFLKKKLEKLTPEEFQELFKPDDN